MRDVCDPPAAVVSPLSLRSSSPHTRPATRPRVIARADAKYLDFFLRLCGLPLWWSHVRTIIRNALGRCDEWFIPDHTMRAIRIESIAMIVVYTFLAAGSFVFDSSLLLYAWLIPAFLCQPFLRLFLMAEHGGCATNAIAFENTRTTRSTALVRWLAWNMPFHAEHHGVPAVPFHRLEELHRFTLAHLQDRIDGVC